MPGPSTGGYAVSKPELRKKDQLPSSTTIDEVMAFKSVSGRFGSATNTCRWSPWNWPCWNRIACALSGSPVIVGGSATVVSDDISSLLILNAPTNPYSPGPSTTE